MKSAPTQNRSRLLLAAALALANLTAVAVDRNWSGGTASYTNTANWTGGVVPGIGDIAVNNNGTNNVVQINAGDPDCYPEPLVPAPDAARAGVLGEFGGLGLGIEGHKWSGQTWWYQGQPDAKTLTSRYGALLQRVWDLQKVGGLSAAVYTQITDVETECNGFLTYDRAVLKMDAERVRRANEPQPLPLTGEMLLPCALQGEFKWRYTTDAPTEAAWMLPPFDDAGWAEGVGGFGASGTPGAIWRTPWKTKDIWLRREFTLPETWPSALSLVIHHDEDAEVYLNGVLAAQLEGYTVSYQITRIRPEALAALQPGRNVIAIHCHQSTGGQFIDAGLLGEAVKE